VTPILLFRDVAVKPGLQVLRGVLSLPYAEPHLITIAAQESALARRTQLGWGPARSYWQITHDGGFSAVMQHRVCGAAAREVLMILGIPPSESWNALTWHDAWAVCLARLLLSMDLHPLPPFRDEEACWQSYLHNWRPGKPDRGRWTLVHRGVRDAAEWPTTEAT
jgi:hypothetical protein